MKQKSKRLDSEDDITAIPEWSPPYYDREVHWWEGAIWFLYLGGVVVAIVGAVFSALFCG